MISCFRLVNLDYLPVTVHRDCRRDPTVNRVRCAARCIPAEDHQNPATQQIDVRPIANMRCTNKLSTEQIQQCRIQGAVVPDAGAGKIEAAFDIEHEVQRARGRILPRKGGNLPGPVTEVPRRGIAPPDSTPRPRRGRDRSRSRPKLRSCRRGYRAPNERTPHRSWSTSVPRRPLMSPEYELCVALSWTQLQRCHLPRALRQ